MEILSPSRSLYSNIWDAPSLVYKQTVYTSTNLHVYQCFRVFLHCKLTLEEYLYYRTFPDWLFAHKL